MAGFGVIEQILTWLEANREWLSWLGGASLVTLILSLIIVPIVVVRMQPDYFLDNRNQEKSMQARHPAMRLFGKIAKNICGGVLVIGGIILCLLPGQGLLTILIGLAVMDFPGKRKLELSIVKRKPVHWAIQKLRTKADQPPLLLPPGTV